MHWDFIRSMSGTSIAWIGPLRILVWRAFSGGHIAVSTISCYGDIAVWWLFDALLCSSTTSCRSLGYCDTKC